MAEDTFISSTYWTDRSGPSAAIATIKKMRKINDFFCQNQILFSC